MGQFQEGMTELLSHFTGREVEPDDRLVEIAESPLDEVVLNLAKNAKYITPEAQNAIAAYIQAQAELVVTTTAAPVEPIFTNPKEQ